MESKTIVIIGIIFIALLAVWAYGAPKCWLPCISGINYKAEDWTQMLPVDYNVENEKRSMVLYFDKPHLDLANQFIMGWGRPKSEKPKLLIWGIIGRNKKGEMVSQTLKFNIVIKNFWPSDIWWYLGEEKLVMKKLPDEGRRMFSPGSKFGKKLKEFFVNDLKLEEKDFLKSIPIITPLEPSEETK